MAIPEARPEQARVKVITKKRGANFSDRNTFRRMEAAGYTAEDIATETKVAVEIVEGFMTPVKPAKKTTRHQAAANKESDPEDWAE